MVEFCFFPMSAYRFDNRPVAAAVAVEIEMHRRGRGIEFKRSRSCAVAEQWIEQLRALVPYKYQASLHGARRDHRAENVDAVGITRTAQVYIECQGGLGELH